MLTRTVRCHQPRQLCSPLRLPFGTVHAAIRWPTAITRSAAVDQPATEAAPAEEVSAEPAAPAAAPAAPPAATAAVEVHPASEAAAPEAAATDGRRPIVRVGRTSYAAATAGYIKNLLDNTPEDTVLVRAIGPAAVAVAVKALTRVTEMVQEGGSSNIVTFRPQRKRIGSERIDVSTVVATDFYVSKVQVAEHNSDTPGSGVGDFPLNTDIPDDLSPLVVKDTTDAAAVEQYIMYAVRQLKRVRQSGPLAYLIVNGRPFAQKVNAALKGVVNSRLNLVDAGKADLTVTVSRIITQVPRRQDDQQQQQQQSEETAAPTAAGVAAAAAAAAAAAEDDEDKEAQADAGSNSNSGEAADAASAELYTRTKYALQVHVCKPRAGSAAAMRPRSDSRRGSSDRPSRSSSSSSTKGRDSSSRADAKTQAGTAAAAGANPSGANPSFKTPGMIEVPEEEWNQLKEQLEVVPHLTEQLQVMTRQHEQLLSLLAVQHQHGAQQNQQQQQQ